MNCPGCQSQLVEKSYRGDILIDECLVCHGVGFDFGEFEAYRKAIGEERRDQHQAPATFVFRDGTNPLRCPRCRQNTMMEGTVREVSVRRCSRCQGLFLSGERITEIARRTHHEAGPNDSGWLTAEIVPELLWVLFS